MTWAIWAPLLAPWLVSPLAERLAALLAPRAAALLLTATGALAAALSTAALGLLATTALLHLPFLAALGHFSPPLLPDGPVTVALGWAALPGCAVAGTAAVRTLRRHSPGPLHSELRSARRTGDLVVLPSDRADAFALPGRPGLVVVTSGMLRALSAEEQAVLLAHERAHLAGRHHLLTLTADLAACLHPALRRLRAPLTFQTERWADETAAATVGDRRLTARAIGTAALAAVPSALRPATALTATAGPVPLRMRALLRPPAPAPRPARRAGAALLLCLLATTTATAEATHDLHENIETAQSTSAP
ncbi:M56 family metallopeptidase [Kitasatospora sp. NPDC096147]|uniref:M56 family metallopeptidase n=1 Tax=Kitasatospora sp. NPDC096147 TaxID=3364093 RepID=UPI00381E8D0C